MDWLDLLAVQGTLKSLLQRFFRHSQRSGEEAEGLRGGGVGWESLILSGTLSQLTLTESLPFALPLS